MAVAEDPVTQGLARLQRLRSEHPDQTQRAVEAAHSDRNPKAEHVFEPGDLGFGATDIGLAVVEGTTEEDAEDRVAFSVVVVDGSARAAALCALVPKALIASVDQGDAGALIVERLRQTIAAAPGGEIPFEAVLALHPVDL